MTMRVALPDAFLRIPLAHRGLHDRAQRRPENSIAAFRAAMAAGYGIELDVQQSRDGQAMVFHDDDLDRLTERKGPLRALNAAELGMISLRDSDETIPTLVDVLALVAGKVPVLVEIKEGLDQMGPTDGRVEHAVAQVVTSYDGPIAVMSFNPHCVAHLARMAPTVPRGLTTEAYDAMRNHPIPAQVCDRLREIPDYDATGSSFVSHDATDLDRPRIAELKANGAAVLCWTIRSPQAEAKARQVAQNITFENYAPALPA